MLKEEFEKLVKKEVETEEFEAWNAAYMASNADKFEFCRRVAPMVKAKIEPKFYGYIRASKNWRGELSVNISTGKSELRNLEEFDGDIPFGGRWFNAFELERGDVVIRSYR